MGKLISAGPVRKQLYDVAFDKIYIKIISSEYKQGQVLYEKQLMEELGIGRTPIREALLRLVSGGIVDSNPNKGFVVRSITLENIKAVFDALEILENAVASLAVVFPSSGSLKEMTDAQEDVELAMRDKDMLGQVLANSRFHTAFYKASRNEYLVYGLSRIQFETKRLAYLPYSRNGDQGCSLKKHYNAVRREHSVIIKCLKNRDKQGLQQICREHNGAFRERIIRYLAS